MQTKNILRIVLGTGLLLLVPLVAMQFSDELAWRPGDFALAAAVLLGAGLGYEWLTSRIVRTAHRAAAGVAVAAALLLVWVNLAVGIIGSEDNPANLMFAGVLAVALIGAQLARLQPQGMARAMYATAIAQAVAAGLAVAIARPAYTPGLVLALGGNAMFVALWVVSGLLFRHGGAASCRTERAH